MGEWDESDLEEEEDETRPLDKTARLELSAEAAAQVQLGPLLWRT